MNFFLILITGLFQVVICQDVSNLPTCGQYCVNQQSNIAVTNGNCQKNHPYCYCGRTDFQNQTVQCAMQQCSSPTDLSILEAWVQGYCADKTWGSKTQSSSDSNSSPPTGVPPSPPPPPGSSTQLAEASHTAAIHIPSGNYGNRIGIAAVAGISVGTCVISFSLLTALLWYCHRYKLPPQSGGNGIESSFLRRRQRQTTAGVSELNLAPQENVRRTSSNGEVHELHYATFEPKEMYAPPAIHELPAQRMDSPVPPPAASLPAALDSSTEDPDTISQPPPVWTDEKASKRRHGFDFSFSGETLPGAQYPEHLPPFRPSERTVNARLRNDDAHLQPPWSRETIVSEISIDSPLSPEEGGNGNGLLGAGLAENANVSTEHIPVSPLVEKDDDNHFENSKREH